MTKASVCEQGIQQARGIMYAVRGKCPASRELGYRYYTRSVVGLELNEYRSHQPFCVSIIEVIVGRCSERCHCRKHERSSTWAPLVIEKFQGNEIASHRACSGARDFRPRSCGFEFTDHLVWSVGDKKCHSSR